MELFPAFALQTTFVATYTLLEDELCDIARAGGLHLKVELDPEDLGDKGIHAAKKYFQKLYGINIADDPNWHLMIRYGQLRNVCAHRRAG